MMDVRAPIEYSKGAFPHSENCPLLDDEQRERIGTRYKEQGQDSAIELGNELATEAIKADRLAQWQDFFKRYPDGVLYCFRGGLRSRITQQWLAEAGLEIPYITGGYKAMRGYLLNELHERIGAGNVQILSGPTGSGKTELIEQWPHSVDLEGLANHRGSAFGRTETEQPAQIDFENAWSIAWMKRTQCHSAPVLMEDESRLIGRIAVLPEFLELSKRSNVVLLQASVEERIERIRRDYAERMFAHKQTHGEEAAIAYLDDFVRSALTRIRKRLGGDRFAQLSTMLDDSLVALQNQQSWQGFDDIVACLLQDYYDPMYTYQFGKKAQNVVFKGNQTEILQWLSEQQQA